MIEENFEAIYKKFRIELYRHIFDVTSNKEDSLSAADYFTVEAVYLLGNPTISEFARTIRISQPNATYRIKSLIEKGYLEKVATEKKSSFRLNVTEKFKKYYHEQMGYGQFIFNRLKEQLSEEELQQADKLFEKIICVTEET